MSTQLLAARRGEITKEMENLARAENVEPTFIRDGILDGSIVITKNNRRDIDGLAIGAGLSTKINANIGSSSDDMDVDNEIEKARVSIEAGAHTIMDLSTGGDIPGIRKTILENCAVPLGTVPIYEVTAQNLAKGKHLLDMTEDDFFDVIERHGRDGVDFITVHCGVTQESVRRLTGEGRLLDIVSRGGAIHAKWMEYHKKENPLLTGFDRLIEIAREYDMTFSLGDGLR
ncbi:Phosphomethylpyrimidine synthase ThiC, partial [hydrothermal vent metagenome]